MLYVFICTLVTRREREKGKKQYAYSNSRFCTFGVFSLSLSLFGTGAVGIKDIPASRR